jgi:hypothetical protein
MEQCSKVTTQGMTRRNRTNCLTLNARQYTMLS